MGYNMGQVLEELLNSIVNARHSSDRTSRELALQYERDELMRMFPVPFVELANVEVELKFSFESPSVEEGPLPYIQSETSEERDAIMMPAPDTEPIPSPYPYPPRPLPVPMYENPMQSVMLRADELAKLPPECVSSIKLSLNVSNYEWNVIDRKDGAPTRRFVRR
jgi:hypothetical protein